jgi:hypothetical protein
MIDVLVHASKTAGESASNPIWLTIVIAALVLAGTLGSPLVTGPREKRRLRSEERRHHAELASEETRHAADLRARAVALQYETKRLTYVDLLALVDQRYTWQFMRMGTPRPPGQLDLATWLTRWRGLEAAISLQDPAVQSKASDVLTTLADWSQHEDDDKHAWWQRCAEAIDALRTEMRASLGLES